MWRKQHKHGVQRSWVRIRPPVGRERGCICLIKALNLALVDLSAPHQMQEQTEAAEMVAFFAEGPDIVPFTNQWDFSVGLKFIRWFMDTL